MIAIFDLALRNGTIVTSRHMFEGNVYVTGDKIAAVTKRDVIFEAKCAENADGLLVFPGCVDAHVHLNDPGYTWREDYEHGTTGAAAGGTTTLIDMPLQNEPALTSASAFRGKHDAVRGKALVDYAFLGGIVDDFPDKLRELHEAGVVGFKVFIGPVSPDYRSLGTGAIREAMRAVSSLGSIICFHAEDYSVVRHEESRAAKENRLGRRDFLTSRPVSAELLATMNVIELARETGARAHICHVSHPDVADRIRRARDEGLEISAETCPHYLIFTENALLSGGAIYKCAPPLRSVSAAERLWKCVEDGDIHCVASDHSPCVSSEKNEENGIFESWSGISGVQTSMQVFYENAVCRRSMSPTLIASRMSEIPARIFGLFGRKGAIAAGFDADMVLFDPKLEWHITPDSLFYKNRISAFVGLSGTGAPVATFVRGKLVFREGERTAEYGHGRLTFGGRELMPPHINNNNFFGGSDLK